MSSTAPVHIGRRMFWALDDALCVWLAYVVEELRTLPEPPDWLAEITDNWAVSAGIGHLGVVMGRPTQDRLDALAGPLAHARQRAASAGDVTVMQLRRWLILDDLAVSNGFSRTGNAVEVERILDVADGFIECMAGTFRPDPPHALWFLGTGDHNSTIGLPEGAEIGDGADPLRGEG